MSPGRGSGMLMDRKLCAEGDRPLQPSHLNTERSEGAMDRARVDRKEAAQPHGSQGGPQCLQASVSRRLVPSSRMTCKRSHTGAPGPTQSIRISFQSAAVSLSFQLTKAPAGSDKLTVPCSRSWELN